MKKILAILNRLFPVKGAKYYVEVVRVWNHASWDTQLNCFTAAHPVFIVKKRNIFGPDDIVNSYWYSTRIEEALDEVRKLNGHDYVANETAYNKYQVYQSIDDDHESGIYVRE